VQKSLLFKTLVVFGLMLLIGIPLAMINATISERMRFRDEAVRSVAADSVRAQSILGPILVLPYTEEYEELVPVVEGKPEKTKTVQHLLNKQTLVFPNEMRVNGAIETDRRYRGIHKILVYSGQYSFAGDFRLPRLDGFERTQPQSRLLLGRPYIAMSIEDVRGVRNIPTINWGDAKHEFQQGSGLAGFPQGLHALLEPVDLKEGGTVKFAFDLGLDGIERQQFVPLAKNNQFTIKSNWPHPQFGGHFLPSPKNRRIDDNGFQASWNISSLSTAAQQEAVQGINRGKAAPRPGQASEGVHGDIDHFTIAFIEPINIYSQADRATKYGLLFVALTFAAFFVFEIMKQLPIHPVQYLLVGLALALFFLMLVSLSEHLDFLPAYLLASSACICLCGFYISHVLRNWRRGLAFGSGLTLLYGALFGLLSSENNALVLGSALLFAVLSAIMVITRKVDWYSVGKT
jgi:inner membrane protein